MPTKPERLLQLAEELVEVAKKIIQVRSLEGDSRTMGSVHLEHDHEREYRFSLDPAQFKLVCKWERERLESDFEKIKAQVRELMATD